MISAFVDSFTLTPNNKIFCIQMVEIWALWFKAAMNLPWNSMLKFLQMNNNKISMINDSQGLHSN